MMRTECFEGIFGPKDEVTQKFMKFRSRQLDNMYSSRDIGDDIKSGMTSR
jgi:hypothetical protein